MKFILGMKYSLIEIGIDPLSGRFLRVLTECSGSFWSPGAE
jgi:hypothetical protein